MKKTNLILLFIGVLSLLFTVSCSDGLDEVYSRLDDLENKKEQEPKIISMSFLAQDNPYQLSGDVDCIIEGDSIISCWIPNIVMSKVLIPHYTVPENAIVLSGGGKIVSGETECDFSKPVELTVTTGSKKNNYTVYVHTFTGLPVCYIDAEGRVSIESKEEYVNATIRIVEDVVTRAAGDVFEGDVQIKGHGNTTWTRFPKKPFRLKFSEKVSLLDEPKDKSWLLLANYADKTLLRNELTFYLSRISCLDYTPSSHYVELILNGSYQGTYQLTDKLKISKNRVNVGDDGFLLEIDDYAPQENDARFFRVNHLSQPCVNIKDPNVEYDDENYTYAKDFVLKAEETLFSEYFKDKDTGWRKYIDINTFVDYYIITEITKNTDTMWGSSFMNLKRGGKLKMGPVWDYDLAYGNYSGIPAMADSEGFRVRNNPWYTRLFMDESFVSRVKERYAFFYARKNDVANWINSTASYLEYSVVENDNKWGVLYTDAWPNVYVMGSYKNEVQFLKEWIFKRMDWLKNEFDLM